MKRFLAILLTLCTVAFFAVSTANAKWWVFGQGNDEVNINYLYLNNNSYDELGAKAVLYKQLLPNGNVEIKGKAAVKKGQIGTVLVSKDNKLSWEKSVLSKNGVFNYSFKPHSGENYDIFIKIIDTTGKTNNIDETHKQIIVADKDVSSDVKDALDHLLKAYENEETNLFMNYVSPNFTGDEVVLNSAIRKDFNAFDLIKINYFINNISSSASGKTFVSISYQRTVVATKSGNTFSDNGNTELIFNAEEGKQKLFSMKNPLIFGLSDAGNVATGTIQSLNNNPIIIIDALGNVNEKPFKTAIDIINDNADLSDDDGSGSSLEILSHTFGVPESLDFATEATAPEFEHQDISYNYFMGPKFWGYHGSSGKINNLGACSSLSNISSVPAYTEAGYIDGPLSPIMGNCYALLVGSFTPPFKYAVIRIENNATMVTPLAIKYKYQPDGSTNF